MSAKKVTATKPNTSAGAIEAGSEKPVEEKPARGRANSGALPNKGGDLQVKPGGDSSPTSEPSLKPDSEDACGGDPASLPEPELPSPYHTESVRLATQLVSAQIVAASNIAAANDTARAVKKIAAEFLMASAGLKADLEDLDKRAELVDAGFVDRAYYNLLNSSDVPVISVSEHKPLDHSDHDTLFTGALARVQMLLRKPSEDESLIHAEQIFEPLERMSESKIKERFENCGWESKQNHTDLNGALASIETWFHCHLNRLDSPDEDTQFEADAEMMTYLLDLCRRRKGLEGDLFSRIYDLVSSHELSNRPRERWNSVEELEHVSWNRLIVSTIYCGRMPAESRKGKRRGGVNFCYPWGLFRFLRIHGERDPLGAKLYEQFVTPRKELKSAAIIHPIYGISGMITDFGPLDRMAEQGGHEAT